ncbi:hypothetical protein LTR97_008298 [Elasticomyces elasticus]|uniref:Uncharacterized protein n=1 Tax=Elasticomyces elasticus TaxID=574655 RepID=A0AAN7ZYX2_9PEZI|nr:hypothetical protein LTR97_008298 [Elasticomyces elasticus]
MAEISVIQVLDKKHYHTQELVSLPDEAPYSPLGPSSIRMRTKVLGLSTNNFTYAKLGSLIGWWDVHPLPPSTPAPFNDAAKYGRINAWGFGEILESTLPSVPAGSYLWGYLPIGTLAQDLEVRDADAQGQVVITSPSRSKTMSIYNRYIVFPPSLRHDIEAKTDSVGYDVLVRVMFETAYLIADYAFPANPQEAVAAIFNKDAWTAQNADLTGATIIILAPGAKVGISLAHLLKNRGYKAKQVIAATSEYSVDFVKSLPMFDGVVLTSEAPDQILSQFKVGAGDKVVLFDCGGRGDVGRRWSAALAGLIKNFLHIPIGGGDTSEVPAEAILSAFQQPSPEHVKRASASDLREAAIAKDGEQKYFDGLEAAWKAFKQQGIPRFELRWGEGMEDVRDGWEMLATNKAPPSEGLVYVI